MLNISRSGAVYVRDRAAELGLIRNRPFPKRVFLDTEVNESITQILRKNRSTKAKELRVMLAKRGHTLSISQIRYRIGALGFRWRKMKRVQMPVPFGNLKIMISGIIYLWMNAL
uniref:Transposase n=1 Tax=Panagrolaimus superbus TaxID=310955 RepID=A0A914Y3J5_9BILA